jgi:hypothetical protein
MHVRPKKALGQHFLHDSAIAARIVEALLSHWPLPATETGVTDGATEPGGLRSVVEVGPGTGVLTTLLLQEPGLDYYAVELDTESVAYLHTLYPGLGNRLVSGDFLKLPAGTFPEQFALIGNFPYNISSQIFFKVLELKDRVPLVVGMLQKEVAERFCSPPRQPRIRHPERAAADVVSGRVFVFRSPRSLYPSTQSAIGRHPPGQKRPHRAGLPGRPLPEGHQNGLQPKTQNAEQQPKTTIYRPFSRWFRHHPYRRPPSPPRATERRRFYCTHSTDSRSVVPCTRPVAF